MKKPGPRSKGKNVGCYGIKDMYKFYKDNYEETIDYKEFAKICKACNEMLIKCVVDEMSTVELPYRLGELQIGKFERSFNKDQKNWGVDWGRSLKAGFKVYYEDRYVYKWCWKKHYAIVKNKTGYKFVSARDSSRIVTPAIKIKKCDYFKP